MPLLFSKSPGCHESHLIRLHLNSLLQTDTPITQDRVNTAQQHDLDELAAFEKSFVALVNQAADLKPNTSSDIILKLKEDLDKHYEQCAGLTGKTKNFKDAIVKLTRIVMQAIWKGAGDDPAAQAELTQEEIARAQHYRLLEIPLVAHLLRPDSPINPEQLVPVLLAEEVEHVSQILALFDHEHLLDMQQQAEALLQKHPGAIAGAPYASSILDLIHEFIERTTQH